MNWSILVVLNKNDDVNRKRCNFSLFYYFWRKRRSQRKRKRNNRSQNTKIIDFLIDRTKHFDKKKTITKSDKRDKHKHNSTHTWQTLIEWAESTCSRTPTPISESVNSISISNDLLCIDNSETKQKPIHQKNMKKFDKITNKTFYFDWMSTKRQRKEIPAYTQTRPNCICWCSFSAFIWHFWHHHQRPRRRPRDNDKAAKVNKLVTKTPVQTTAQRNRILIENRIK